MRLALLSDVHANAPALEAVLDDLPPVDRIVHGGDVVGYGPFPEAVIDLFREHDVVSIQGNHDRAVLGEFHEDFHRIPKRAALWTADRLDDDDLAYLEELPVELDDAGGDLHVAHGAPNAPNTYTYPQDFDPSLLGDERVLMLGHTHEQALEEFENGAVVNPGSVGLPRDGDPRAAYAVLDCTTWSIELRRVEYEVARTQRAIREHGLPEELVEGLDHGELIFGRTQRAAEDAG